jgi:hypothetical protein
MGFWRVFRVFLHEQKDTRRRHVPLQVKQKGTRGRHVPPSQSQVNKSIPPCSARGNKIAQKIAQNKKVEDHL